MLPLSQSKFIFPPVLQLHLERENTTTSFTIPEPVPQLLSIH